MNPSAPIESIRVQPEADPYAYSSSNSLTVGEKFISELETIFPEGYIDQYDPTLVGSVVAEKAIKLWQERYGSDEDNMAAENNIRETIRVLSVDPERADLINRVRGTLDPVDEFVEQVTQNSSKTGRMDFLTSVNDNLVFPTLSKVGRKETDFQSAKAKMEAAKKAAKLREEQTKSVGSIIGGSAQGTTQGIQYTSGGNTSRPIFVN